MERAKSEPASGHVYEAIEFKPSYEPKDIFFKILNLEKRVERLEGDKTIKDRQIGTLEKQMEEQEKQIVKFKKEHQNQIDEAKKNTRRRLTRITWIEMLFCFVLRNLRAHTFTGLIDVRVLCHEDENIFLIF